MDRSGKDVQEPGSPEKDDDEGGFIDVLIILAKHKVMIIALTVAAAVLSAIVVLLLPNIYTGVARVLPPQKSQTSAAMLLGQLSGLSGLAGSALGIKDSTDLYVGMLKSRTVADNIIERFELRKLYDKDTMEETRKEFADNSNVAANRDGLIVIAFDDEDPKRAAAVANAYVENLDKLTQTLAVTEAGQRRLFFERQLQQAKEELRRSEVALKTTQEKTGLIKLDEQGKAIIEAVATLRAQISAKEVELQAMRTFATEKNIEYVRAREQLSGLRKELTKLERAQIAGGGDVLLPTGRVPEAGLEYLRSYRDVKYAESMFEVLAKQFEAAKIDEARESLIVQVVDLAVPPDHKSKPKRALTIVVATLAGIFLAILWAFFREFLERAKSDPIQNSRLSSLQKHLRAP